MKSKRLMIIGFDTADYRLCEKWASDGCMLHFERLTEKSKRVAVRNPKGFEPGSLWPCFNMGSDVDEWPFVDYSK